MLKRKERFHYKKRFCSRCPYALGLVSTFVSPCPACGGANPPFREMNPPILERTKRLGSK